MIGYEMIRTPDKRPTNHMSDNMSDFLHTRNTSSHVNIYNTVNTVYNLYKVTYAYVHFCEVKLMRSLWSSKAIFINL